ncbi:hypothetical protein ACSSWA_10145 [Melioribacter sp. Ez-97]|uniref:hypothetical protein n=1 Tax=Melioribacter sp. Ez-97 TaxID=3423434 RepID=UPI003EDABE6D
MDFDDLPWYKSIVYFTLDDVQFTAKINSVTELRVNENIDMYLELDRLHFFDKDTELRLS